MPKMTYQDYVGKEYKFKKSERVPQWLYEGGKVLFNVNVLVIPLKDKVFMFGKVKKDRTLMQLMNEKDIVTQVCPMISFYTSTDIVL